MSRFASAGRAGSSSRNIRTSTRRSKDLIPYVLLAQLIDEIVVLLVSANPKSDNEITMTARQRAVVGSDSNRPNVSEEGFEMQRWMKLIALP